MKAKKKGNMASRGKFTIVLMILQTIFIVLFGIFVKYDTTGEAEEQVPGIRNSYPSKSRA